MAIDTFSLEHYGAAPPAGSPASLSRYRALFLAGPRRSVLRTLQYERLRRLPPLGRVLDFGGGDRADYRDLLSCTSYASINIDARMAPTWLTAVGQPLPVGDIPFDTVLSMNTFEHIFDVQSLLRQLHGALVEGGRFITMVPFLFPLHAHPDDFFRPAPSWWKRALADAGFAHVAVEPLYWGRSSTAAVCGGMSGPFKPLRLHLALLADVVSAKLNRAPADLAMSRAVGYVVHAAKGMRAT